VQALIDDIADFHTTVGSQDEGLAVGTKAPYVPLKEAFWQCSNEFNKKGNTFKDADFKRVWLFTNDDNPNCKYPAEQLQVIQVGKDLAETNIEVSLWHLSRPLNTPSSSSAVPSAPAFAPFNIDIFYNKILVCDEDELASRVWAVADDGFEGMLTSVRRKQCKKRRMGTLAFYLAGDPGDPKPGSSTALSVHFYKTLNITKKPYPTTLYAKNNKPVLVRTQYLDGTTGEQLDESDAAADIETYIDVQGTRVPFSKSDVQTITRRCASGLSRPDAEVDATAADPKTQEGGGFIKLLYCTAHTSLPPDLNISSGYFLAPDEAGVRGSGLLFTALLDDLHAKRLVGVAVFVRNKSSAPRVVAVIPQRESQQQQSLQASEGLFLVPLPFAGDLRVSATGGAAAVAADAVSDDAFRATLDMVRCFQPQQAAGDDGAEQQQPHLGQYLFNNPTVQRFYTVLQTIALSENIDAAALDALDSSCFPDRAVFERAGNQAVFEAYKETMRLDEMQTASMGAGVGKKRAAGEAEGGGRGAKKAKEAEPQLSAEELEEYRALARDGGLKKESVAELKEMCRSLGLALGGKKDELVARITAAVL
jgi:ATP-dependent DNA helicase 2 subunit 1